MQHSRRNDVVRIRVDPVKNAHLRPSHNPPVLRNIDLARSRLEHDRENLLRFPRRSSDLLPPLEEARRVEFDRFHELDEPDREAEGDGLERSGEVGDLEDGRSGEDFSAVDVHELLYL
jgi:hypothetical protein